MHSKTGNGVNVADEFTAGKVSSLPKSERLGRQAEPLDEGILANVRAILTDPNQGAVFGKTLYSATAAELNKYNKEALEADPPRQAIDIPTLARRFAFNGCANVKRYVAAVAKEQGKAVGVRIINESKTDIPAMRWVLLMVKPKPRKTS